MENKKYKPKMYKPKIYTAEDMQNGLKGLLSGEQGKQRRTQLKQLKQDEQQQRQAQQYQQPRFGQPQKSLFQPQPLQQQIQPIEPEPEQPYWSGEEWEAWAYQIYVNYPEMRQYLPEWFLQALEEATK